jgi:signal transduction histidine kinase
MAAKDRKDLLLEAGLALSSDLALDALLQRIVEIAAQLTSARYGALGVLGPGGVVIKEFITTGVTQAEREAIGHIPHGRGILGALIHDARPLRLRDIAEDPRSVGFPANHPPMRSFLGAPVEARGEVFGNIYLTEKMGATEFSAEDQETLVTLATQAGFAVANARLYEQSQRRSRWLEGVQEITAASQAARESREVLEIVARRARQLVGADLATIVTVGEGGAPAVTVTDGAHAKDLLGLPVPLQGSVSGEVMRTRRAVVLEDASRDSRTYQPMVKAGHMGPAVFVPLAVRDRPLGTLAVANLRGGAQFTPDDVGLVESFANQASVALDYERAQRELRRLAVLDERERIARELHDGVIQSLFAVGMGLQATATRAGDERLEKRIEGAVAEIDRAIRDLRNYIFGLRPGILADRQLEEALRELARDFEERSGVTSVVEVDPAVAAELTGRASDVIQLTREALSNIGRHAEAATCRVSLRRVDGGALLEVDDDGRGFDLKSVDGSGQGLRNIRERSQAMGASLDIESRPKEGTTIRVTIPT